MEKEGVKMTTKIETKYKKELKTQSGKNYTAVHAGEFGDLHQFEVFHPRAQKHFPGKLFLREPLGLTGMQVSLNKIPAGTGAPFYHRHKENEELYIFVGGSGQMQIDGEVVDVEEGTAIRIAPGGERTWRNVGKTDLSYIVIQAKENSLAQETFEDGLASDRKVEW
jgi:mannose-6-phosphate isomerase-like protein (cupin superfamily)